MKHLVVALSAWLVLALPVVMAAQRGDRQNDPRPALGVGTVRFEISCADLVKNDFNRAVAELHSFWLLEARAGFQSVLEVDRGCAMAYWGIALTYWGNPFVGPKSPQVIAAGQAAIAQARITGAPTPRERSYIDAVAGLFSSPDPATHRARVLEYERSMAVVAANNPIDTEARIFWALAIAQTGLPTDKTFTQNLRSAEILEPLFRKFPTHPGLAHYIIHVYDVPSLAEKALPAARSYTSIAPSVPHALHMPSHAFTRVGLWKESVAANIRSATEAQKLGSTGEVLHALDYQIYAHLQMAQDAEAKAVFDRAALAARSEDGAQQASFGTTPNGFATAAIPARYAMERQQWAEALQLTVRPSPATPYAEAVTHFVRAVAAARSGQPAMAAADVRRLLEIRDQEVTLKDFYWAEQVDIQRRVAEAWVAFASGRKDDGIRMLAAAADAEDSTDKSVVTPGPIAPARELYGFMLLEAGRAGDAATAFEAVTKKEPNRFLALYGAGLAAEAAKQRSKAKDYYERIAQMCRDAAPDRAELSYARKMAK